MLKKVFKGIGIGVGMIAGMQAVRMYANIRSSDSILEESELPPLTIFAHHCYAYETDEKDFKRKCLRALKEGLDRRNVEFISITFDDENRLENKGQARLAFGLIIKSEEDYLRIQKHIEDKKDKMLTLTKLPMTKCIKTSISFLSVQETEEKVKHAQKLKEYQESTNKDFINFMIFGVDLDKKMASFTLALIEDTTGPYDFSVLPHPIKK